MTAEEFLELVAALHAQHGIAHQPLRIIPNREGTVDLYFATQADPGTYHCFKVPPVAHAN